MRRFQKYKKLSDRQREYFFNPLREPASGNLDYSDTRNLSLWDDIFDNLRYIVKDVRDTFKPYKNFRQSFRDLVSLSLGVSNITKALLGLFSMTFILIVATPLLFFQANDQDTQRKANQMKKTFFKFYASHATLLLRGIFQVVLTPLHWCRIPLRSLIGWLFGVPRIEDNVGIKKLVAECYNPNATDDTIFLAEKALHHKVIKANMWYQTTSIPILHQVTHLSYEFSFRFFPTPPAQQNHVEEVIINYPPVPG